MNERIRPTSGETPASVMDDLNALAAVFEHLLASAPDPVRQGIERALADVCRALDDMPRDLLSVMFPSAEPSDRPGLLVVRMRGAASGAEGRLDIDPHSLAFTFETPPGVERARGRGSADLFRLTEGGSFDVAGVLRVAAAVHEAKRNGGAHGKP